MARDYFTFRERCDMRIYHFPIIVEGNFPFDMSLIHPLQQKAVKALYEEISKDNNVLEAWIFGSSASMACNIYSDIDLAVKTIDGDYWNSKLPTSTFRNDIDYINMAHVKEYSNLWYQIRKGVLIYEQIVK